jgi:hypothetical protein
MTFDQLEFKPHPRHAGGKHASVSFANGYGASVIQSSLSYGGNQGLYELAVLQDGKLCYTTPITDDVLGWLRPDDVTDLLGQIEGLLP